MTKRIFFSLVVLCILNYSVFAQYNFVVQNGTATVFKTLDLAYSNASTGDTIYLPGGSFNLPGLIDKPLVWYGVGYHPDSTEATYFTRINNQATFSGNCDNMFISGIHFESNVVIGSNGNDAVNVTIHRCRIKGSLSLKYADGDERDINTLVTECIIDGTIDGSYGNNVHIEKCILKGYYYRFRSSLMENCIMTLGGRDNSWGRSYCINDCQNCLIINSIFNYNAYASFWFDRYNNRNNRFDNNIFAAPAAFPDGTNTGLMNLTSVDLTSVFEHIEGDLQDFSFIHDFHLKTASPAIGAGTGGIDIGIYGPADAFKVGGLPVVPHIRKVEIDQRTNNGLLHIEIEAASQDK